MRQFRDIERRLRKERPQPRDEFVTMLAERVEGHTRRRTGRARLALVAAVTAAFAVAVATTGGFAYAASAAKTVVVAAKVVVGAPVSVVKSETSDAKADSKPASAPAPAKDGTGGKPDDDQYGHKKHVCHKPGKHQETLVVADNAVPAHLAHGDYLGDCKK